MRRFLSLLVLCTLQFPLFSCTWFDADELRMMMFRQDLITYSDMQPYFYTNYYMNGVDADVDRSDVMRNCKEWQTALGAGIPIEHIDQLLNSFSPDDFINGVTNKTLKSAHAGNKFIQALLESKNKAYLEYMVYAKKNENFQAKYLDPWSETPDGKDRTAALLIGEGEKLIKKTKNVFLRKRYAYQLVRLYRNADRLKECKATYAKYFDENGAETILNPWSMIHVAYANYQDENYAKANYLLSRVFDLCDSRKVRIYQSFDKGAVEDALGFCKTDKERAGLIALSQLHNPGRGLEGITKLYNLDKNSPYLGVLIVREISKLEDWLYTQPYMNGYYSGYATDEEFNFLDFNRSQDETYLEALRLLLVKIYNDGTFAEKDLVALAVSHLAFIQDKVPVAAEWRNKISPDAKGAIKSQAMAEELLAYTRTQDLANADVKDKIADMMARIKENNQEVGYDSEYRFMASLTMYLSKAFEKSGDLVSAGLLNIRSYQMLGGSNSEYNAYDSYYHLIGYFDNSASTKDVDKLIALCDKRNKSKFEEMICEQALASKSVYLDLKGTLAFRAGDLHLAMEAFLQVQPDFWRENYSFSSYLNENPFEPKLIFTQQRDFGYVFNKLAFVKEMLRLEAEAQNNPDKAARAYLKLAHGWYNCTWYGNSWMMTRYGWSTYDVWAHTYSDESTEAVPVKEGDIAYFTCTKAAEYYRKALEARHDDEIGAQATLMLHFCDFSKLVWDGDVKGDDYDTLAKGVASKSPWLKNFASKYRNTETFKNYECPNLDDYVKN